MRGRSPSQTTATPASVMAMSTTSASRMPASSTDGLAAIAPSTGMPIVDTCWVMVVSPVARPCSSSGSPEVAVRL